MNNLSIFFLIRCIKLPKIGNRSSRCNRQGISFEHQSATTTYIWDPLNLWIELDRWLSCWNPSNHDWPIQEKMKTTKTDARLCFKSSKNAKCVLHFILRDVKYNMYLPGYVADWRQLYISFLFKNLKIQESKAEFVGKK